MKRNEAGWEALTAALSGDEDANVRAEAANALASYGVERAWPLLRQSFAADDQWLVRCSILSALAEQPEIEPGAAAGAGRDGHRRCRWQRAGGRSPRFWAGSSGMPAPDGTAAIAETARQRLSGLQQDSDHRVVAAALNGLQG